MNSSIFQVSSTTSQAQIAALFDNQLNHTLCTIYLIEQYQRIVGQDNHIQIDTTNIEVLSTSLLNQLDLLTHIYKRYEQFLEGFNPSQQAGQIQPSHLLTIDPDSSSLQLHDFITLQLAMVKAAYCCFFDISECLGMAECESYYHALQNSISTIKNMLEQLKQAFKHLQAIAVISVH